MNKTITLLAACAIALAATAQNKADIEVSYDQALPSHLHQGKPATTKMLLLASATEAKYFNTLSLWVDSLKSTPEGKAQYMEILKKTCMTVEPDGSTLWDLSKGPAKRVYTSCSPTSPMAHSPITGSSGKNLANTASPSPRWSGR